AWIGDADTTQHLFSTLVGIPPRGALMNLSDFGELRSDRVDRRQRRHRLLKDHGDLVTADATDEWPSRIDLRQINLVAGSASKANRAFGDATGFQRQEPEDRVSGDAFAAAGFADQAEGLARLDVEGDAVDGAHDAVMCEEVGPQLIEPQEGVGANGIIGRPRRSDDLHQTTEYGSVASRNPSPRKLKASTAITMAPTGARSHG